MACHLTMPQPSSLLRSAAPHPLALPPSALQHLLECRSCSHIVGTNLLAPHPWPRATASPPFPLCTLVSRKPMAIRYPSACGHRRLGPSTMATLLGVILFMSWYSVNLARNLIRYLEG